MLQLQPETSGRVPDRFTLIPDRVTLVLGGARSGKSRYGQQRAANAARVTVIVTAQPRGDDEMEQRIARHRADRPANWLTIEEPLDLPSAIAHAAADSDLILIDCLTLYAANLLESYSEDQASIDSAVGQLLQAIAVSPCPIVLVANEVGSGVVPEYPSGRRFRDLAGELNQRAAAAADRVILMVAGLPLVLKGAQS